MMIASLKLRYRAFDILVAMASCACFASRAIATNVMVPPPSSGRRRQNNVMRAAAGGSESQELKRAAAEADVEALKKDLGGRASIAKPEIPADARDKEMLAYGPQGGMEKEKTLSSDEDGIPKDRLIRRLLIGGGLAAAALTLGFYNPPRTLNKPPQPLPYYVAQILELKQRLLDLENADIKSAYTLLQPIAKSADSWKETFLSATSWLEGGESERGFALSEKIYEYLRQIDYNQYFEVLGVPSETEQLDYWQFSQNSAKFARGLIEEFISCLPGNVVAQVEADLSTASKAKTVTSTPSETESTASKAETVTSTPSETESTASKAETVTSTPLETESTASKAETVTRTPSEAEGTASKSETVTSTPSEAEGTASKSETVTSTPLESSASQAETGISTLSPAEPALVQ